MDFSSAAGELYGLPPAGFVAARTRLARQAKEDGDAVLAKRIGSLRRPTLSAWAVNLLARSAPGELDRLLEAGEEMRAAWGSGGGLGDLEQRRARLVRDLVRTAGGLAAREGAPLRDQAVREVEDTLRAATVDAGVAEEVRAGRLPQPRSHTGFVPMGFAPAPGGEREKPKKAEERHAKVAEKPEKPEKTEEPERKRAATRPKVSRTSVARAKRAETLRKRADEAERALAGRTERAGEAREEAEAASAEVGRLRHELERAIAARDSAARRAERAEQARSRAHETAREARKAAADARRAADRDTRDR